MRRKTPRICNYLEYLKNHYDHFMDRDPYEGKCKVKDKNGKWVEASKETDYVAPQVVVPA
jgi:hypothetical protein